jgi:hypothetical protein
VSDESRLPPHLDPRHTKETGLQVLDHGLPELPDVLTHQMSVPLAFWKATTCAVVLFLRYSGPDEEGRRHPSVGMRTFYREGERWDAHPWWGGTGWSHDPIVRAGSLRDLDGQAITGGSGSHNPDPLPGYPAAVVAGRVSPAVSHLAVVQDDVEVRRKLRSHFGAWVVCTETWSPYEINALDETGAVLGCITGPPRIPPMTPIRRPSDGSRGSGRR